MTKSRTKKKSKAQKSTTTTVGGRAKRRMGIGMPAAIADWRKMIMDPCSAALVRPPYAGCDAGYLIRTVNGSTPYFQANGTDGPTTGNFVVQLTPWNLDATHGYISGGADVGGFSMNSGGLGNFITTSTVVRSYRPIACCMKWIPTGPVSSRAGLVGVSYGVNTSLVAGDVVTAGAIVSSGLRYASNGSEDHEVRWLPTETDALWTTILDATKPGAGSVTIALEGVDGVRKSNTLTLNGRLEVAICWEWQPKGFNDGIVTAPHLPLPFSLNAAMASLGDITQALVGKMASRVYSEAPHMLANVLGMTYAARRRAAMITT